MKGLVGRKIGMTQMYDDGGNVVPITVVEAGPCTVISLRTTQRDGYSALQLGMGRKRLKNVSKAVRNHIQPAGFTDSAPTIIREIRLREDPEEKIGDQLDVTIFHIGDFVDVTGISKGRGFQGVIRRYRFGGGRGSHGGDWLRRPGSVGMCVEPGKIYKGRKMPGQMGNVRRTVQNIRVMNVIPEDHLLVLRGAIPGANGNHVIVRQSKKKAVAS